MKRLITDHDVLTGAVAPPLLLDENTLITPSARDRAARMGWAIVEAGGRAAPSAAMSTGAPGVCGAAPCARCGSAGCAGNCGASGASSASVASSGKSSCDGACGGGLADGLYLVRIEGGRRVSVLPAAGPGVMARAIAALPAQQTRGGG